MELRLVRGRYANYMAKTLMGRDMHQDRSPISGANTNPLDAGGKNTRPMPDALSTPSLIATNRGLLRSRERRCYRSYRYRKRLDLRSASLLDRSSVALSLRSYLFCRRTPVNNYPHETCLAPVAPFDRLQPTTRQFTGTPHVHRAYVLNRTTGKIVEACGHRHRNNVTAARCAETMMADVIKQTAKSGTR